LGFGQGAVEGLGVKRHFTSCQMMVVKLMTQILQTFEDLECYKSARQLRIALAKTAKGLAPDEIFRLQDQLIRAARSITANIAEGFGRHHHGENLQYCRQARGSLSECMDHISAGLDEGLISYEIYVEHRAKIEESWKILNGYIAHLKRCAESGVPRSE
jgi:four helix bundle protein